MEYIYLIIVVLIALSLVGLIVGFSSDAVNFLSTSKVSKVTKLRYTYLAVWAGLLLVGCFVTAYIWRSNIYYIAPLIILAGLIIYSVYKIHEKAKVQRKKQKKEHRLQVSSNMDTIIEVGSERIRKHILETAKIYILIIQGFVEENEKQLKDTCEKVGYLEKTSRSIKEDLFNNLSYMSASKFDAGHHFIQALEYLGQLTSGLKQMSEPVYNHIENQHKGLSKTQKEDALLLLEDMTSFFNYLVHIEKGQRFDSVPEMIAKQHYIITLIEDLRKKQIKRVTEGRSKTRSSILLLECYAESKNLILYTIKLLKAHRDFCQLSSGNK